MAGSSHLTKIADFHYVGLDRLTPTGISSENIDVKWKIDELLLIDKDEIVKGNWKFTFSLQATESQVQLTNQSVEQNGVTVNIEKIMFTPMSFIVHYNQKVTQHVQDNWHEASVDLHIKDDLGNTYSGEGNGGSGTGAYSISWSDTFEKLDPNAAKLIITPHIIFRIHDEMNSGGVKITADGKEKEIPIPTKAGIGKEEFVMKDIVIELEK